MRTLFKIAGAAILLFLLFGLRLVVPSDPGGVEFTEGDHKTLVVFAPGMGGRTSTPDLETLVRAAYPAADFLIPTYSNSLISNASPYAMARVIEREITKRDGEFKYEKVVLFGYSLGGLLLRKAYIWGWGSDFEDDNSAGHETRPWVKKVDRFVSLAAPNRGWPSGQPTNLPPEEYMLGYAGMVLARVTGIAEIVRTVQQGSPFVANMRVQWIGLFRSQGFKAPLVVHLLSDKDELVDRDDSIDLEAGPDAGLSKSVIIKTLEGLSHRETATHIYESDRRKLTPSGEAIRLALTKTRDELPADFPDKTGRLRTEPEIRHLIFVTHGIRDESTWPDEITRAIENREDKRTAAAIKVVPLLYRRFAMLPFLLYWDRQQNVRWFMDQYTEARAKYPRLETVDFVGHSNGTYILASALQQYSALRVRNVFFAGSVVPVHYNWPRLIDNEDVQQRRVTGKILNVCADFDWVVAIFPQFFQQISDWMNISEPEVGPLDIGSAGFRGFRKSVGTQGILTNVKWISGDHGAALDAKWFDAIADFIVSDDASGFREEAHAPRGHLEQFSNLSWAIWTIGLGLIALVGMLAYRGAWWLFGIYAIAVLGLLTTW